MKKLLSIILSLSSVLLNISPVFSANEWRAGTGQNTMLGTSDAADIDASSYQYIVAPLDRVLSVYRRGAQITYASTSTLTVGIGEVVCSNSAGTIRKLRANTSATTVTATTTASTTFYIYAIADADANTFTCEVSTSSSTPSGTYFRRLGSYYSNASGQVTNISNDDSIKPQSYDTGWFAVTTGTSYTKTHSLGTTKLNINVYYATDSSGSNMVCYTGNHEIYHNYGAYLGAITATTVTLKTDSTYLWYDLINTAWQTSGYARIIIEALE